GGRGSVSWAIAGRAGFIQRSGFFGEWLLGSVESRADFAPVIAPLTLTLSRLTGEGTARRVSRSFQSGWIRRPTEDDSPSPIRWERAGVRVNLPGEHV